jgi:hypothetical protein
MSLVMQMKIIGLCSGALFLASTMSAQLTGIVAEVHAIHDTDAIPDIEGMTTYRVYAVVTNESDEISAVYGDAAIPLSLISTEGFYQTSLGSNLGWNINSAFYSLFPEVEFDSWVTMGVSNSSEVTGQPNTVGMDEPFTAFDAGGDMIVNSANGGSWFTLFGDTQAQAGPDLKVMIAQLTTSGSFSGTFNVQVFINGNQLENAQYFGVPFSSNEGAVFGCMDPAATNYNADATESGETCLYPCAISLTLDEVNHTSCPGAGDGEIFVSAEGEQLGVLYGINGATPIFSVGHFDGLSEGVYTIAVIDGAGCEASIEVEIVPPSPIVLNASYTPVTCAGDSDGVISGSAEGGSGGFQFSLSSDFMDSSAELYFDGLAAGFYTVFVQDANGCMSSSVSISIADPQPLNVTVSGGQDGILDATCSDSEDGQIVVLTMGGAGNQSSMTYSTNGVDFAPGNILFLAGGTYTIYAMDVNGCIGETANQYTVDAPDPITINTTVQDVSCNGMEDGSISFSAEGGNGGFIYSIAGVEFNEATNHEGLAAGTYELLVYDMVGCFQAEIIQVLNPEPLQWSIELQDAPSCNNGFIGIVDFEASGGTGPYELEWDGSVVFGTLWTLYSQAGEISFLLTDAYGCADSSQYLLEGISALEGYQPVLSDPTCYGAMDGQIANDPAFDFTEWQVTWEGPSVSGTEEVFDEITNLAAGEYSLELSSQEYPECSTMVVVALGQPAAMMIESEVAGPVCEEEGNGMLFAGVDNEQGSVFWALNDLIVGEEHTLSMFGLAPGTYALSVTDELGCQTESNIVVPDATPLQDVVASIAHPTSFTNGSIDLNLSQGWEVIWYNGEGEELGAGSAISGLQAGHYSAGMTNPSGCGATFETELLFAGCDLVSASDWPAGAEGIFPEGISEWNLGMNLNDEWVLKIPEVVYDLETPYQVVGFEVQEWIDLPEGVVPISGTGEWIEGGAAGCLVLSGQPQLVGEYLVQVLGEFTISVFGAPYILPNFAFERLVLVTQSVDPIEGCTYAWATNYNPFATDDDGSCAFDEGCPNPEACNYHPLSSNAEEACEYECQGCTYSEAENYDPNLTQDDGSCIFDFSGGEGACFYDFDSSGQVGSGDLLSFLEAYGVICP